MQKIAWVDSLKDNNLPSILLKTINIWWLLNLRWDISYYRGGKCQLPIFFLIEIIFWHTVFSCKAAVVEYLVDCTQWLLWSWWCDRLEDLMGIIKDEAGLDDVDRECGGPSPPYLCTNPLGGRLPLAKAEYSH